MRDAARRTAMIAILATTLMSCTHRDTVGTPALGVVAAAEHSGTGRGDSTLVISITNTAPKQVCIELTDEPTRAVQLRDSVTREPIDNFFDEDETVEWDDSGATFPLPAGDGAILVIKLDPRDYDLNPGQYVRAVARFVIVDCGDRDANGGIWINDRAPHGQVAQIVTSGETRAFIP